MEEVGAALNRHLQFIILSQRKHILCFISGRVQFCAYLNVLAAVEALSEP